MSRASLFVILPTAVSAGRAMLGITNFVVACCPLDDDLRV